MTAVCDHYAYLHTEEEPCLGLLVASQAATSAIARDAAVVTVADTLAMVVLAVVADPA